MGRPRRLRLSGVGNSWSLVSHALQYTLPWVWARYQRQPHPSQIFKCTRVKSMTKSPCSCFLPTGLLSYLFSAGLREPGMAAQGSCALMRGIASGILSFFVMLMARRSWNSDSWRPRTPLRGVWSGDEKAGRDFFISRQLFMNRWKRGAISPVSTWRQ